MLAAIKSRIRRLLRRLKFKAALYEQVFLLVVNFDHKHPVEFGSLYTWDECAKEIDINDDFYCKIYDTGLISYIPRAIGSYELMHIQCLKKSETIAIMFRPHTGKEQEKDISRDLFDGMLEYLHNYEEVHLSNMTNNHAQIELKNSRIRQINKCVIELNFLKRKYCG